MLFNSFAFLLFFIVVTTTYFLLPHKFRTAFLLACSCFFYMYFVPVYILILGFTIVLDYFAGIYLEKITGHSKRIILLLSLIANIGVLAVFKYYNFINENISDALGLFGIENHIPYLSILLPIGLSFHTFQAMSYTIEVYRGNQKAEKNFLVYALYVMFYPQLVAGPIERPQNLLHQFHKKHYFEYSRLVEGLKLMLWGIFKKVVIADRLSIYVNTVYDNPAEQSGITLAVATVFFSFQIYCDFSGYSDIAIGAAKVMGFNLMDNFKRPYFSKSISEFWNRWHISLSTWFKDYVYISLGGNRVSIPRWYINLLIVFLLSGLWHGANWTYIIWGALNGAYLIFAIVTENVRTKALRLSGFSGFNRLITTINIFTTFCLVSIAWVFFRAKNASDAFLIIKKMVLMNGPFFSGSKYHMLCSVLGIIFLLFVEIRSEFFGIKEQAIKSRNWVVEQFYYASLIIIILLMGVFDGSQFIYFQF